MHPFTHPRTYKRGSYLFSDMTRINWDSTTRAYLPSITLTERTNYEKCFRWLWQWLPWLSFLIFSHLTRSPVIGSYLYVSASASWCQWWRRLDNPINLGPSHLPVFTHPSHFTDLYIDRIWYSPDVWGVRRVQMLRQRNVGIDKGVRHRFCCDTWWLGFLCAPLQTLCHICCSGFGGLGEKRYIVHINPQKCCSR